MKFVSPSLLRENSNSLVVEMLTAISYCCKVRSFVSTLRVLQYRNGQALLRHPVFEYFRLLLIIAAQHFGFVYSIVSG